MRSLFKYLGIVVITSSFFACTYDLDATRDQYGIKSGGAGKGNKSGAGGTISGSATGADDTGLGDPESAGDTGEAGISGAGSDGFDASPKDSGLDASDAGADTGSEARCGNGVVERGEKCDGNCPSNCDDGNPCTRDERKGSDATCDVRCIHAQITACSTGDVCCPGSQYGCNAVNDGDCLAVCGNGVVETGETCDPVSACDTLAKNCVPDQDTIRTPRGKASSCTFECIPAKRPCAHRDTFCPTGCTRTLDNDCLGVLGEDCTNGVECLSGNCANSVCCNSACNGACEACDRQDSVGTCSTPNYSTDAANCGTCGTPCSSNNATPACNNGGCTSACNVGWEDCNSNLRTDGCETHTENDPTHCGSCGTHCQYGLCFENKCKYTKWGFSEPGPFTEDRKPNTFVGTRIRIGIESTPTTLVALGIQTRNGDVNVRIGLYSEVNNAPSALIAQTEELSSVKNGATEGYVPKTMIAKGYYWIFFVSTGTLSIATEDAAETWWYSPMSYGLLPQYTPGLTLLENDPGLGDIYAVTTP